MPKDDPELLARVKEIAPGFYTERDGGDWYVLTPNHARVAEGFARRDDARRCLAWLAGDAMPAKWKILKYDDLSADLDCGQGYAATIWTREIDRTWPDQYLWADAGRKKIER